MMPTGLEKSASTAAQENKPVAFDYSGLDAQTVDTLHMAETQYTQGKKMAETGLRWMVNAVAMAHDALCGTVVQQLDNGRFAPKDDTFRAWCASISLSKSSAYNLLRVAERFGNIQLDGKSILDVQPATLLYEAAKPSAPAELAAQVKSGDITTHKQYQEALAQLKAEKERADAAENHEAEAWDMVSKAQSEARAAQDKADTAKAERDAAIADVNGLMEQNTQLKKKVDAAEAREEEAWKLREKAEARAKDAENQLAGSRQVAEAAKLRGDKLKAENDALKQQPITAVVDEEEVDRRAGEKAYRLAADMTAELQAKLDAATGSTEQDARNAYDGILLANRAIINTWQIARPLFRKLPEEQREALANQIARTIGNIQGEVTKCL